MSGPSRADIRAVQQIKNVVGIDPCIVPLLDHRQQPTQLRDALIALAPV